MLSFGDLCQVLTAVVAFSVLTAGCGGGSNGQAGAGGSRGIGGLPWPWVDLLVGVVVTRTGRGGRSCGGQRRWCRRPGR